MVSTGPAASASNVARARRRSRRRLGFAATLALMLLLGQEFVFRLEFPKPEVDGFNRIHYQMLAGMNPDLEGGRHWELRYHRLLLESRPDGYSEAHHLNRYGFRGPDFAIDPTPGRRRVVVIGDSVTEGQGAPEASTIPAQLQRLADAARTGEEVLNLGVIAATLMHTTALARDAISLLRPSDVVVVVYANDLPAPPYPPELDRPAPAFRRRDDPWWMPRLVELIGDVTRDEPIFHRWPHAARPFFLPAPHPTNPWSRMNRVPEGLDPSLHAAMAAGTINPWLHEQALAIPGMLAHDFAQGGSPSLYLLRLDSLAVSRGARLILAYVPFCGVVHPRYADPLTRMGMPAETAKTLASDPRYRRQNRLLATLCAERGIPFVDTTDALAEAEARGEPQYWEFDTHPRPAGHATIARRIHEAMR